MTMNPDLGALLDAHMRFEFVERDVDATMRTMTANADTPVAGKPVD